MVVPVMLRQLRHDVWATEKLLAHLRTLTDAQLDLTVAGTYGTIRRTLAHIVDADERYLARLLGAWHDRPLPEDHDATLDEIATHIAHVNDGVERVFAGRELDPNHTSRGTPLQRPGAPRFEMELWVPATQFVHHGNDHRAQIGTILGAHGIETPDVQVWPYAMQLGASREVKEDQ